MSPDPLRLRLIDGCGLATLAATFDPLGRDLTRIRGSTTLQAAGRYRRAAVLRSQRGSTQAQPRTFPSSSTRSQ